MNESNRHILTKNIISLKKAYLTEVVKPALSRVEEGTESITRQYQIAGKRVRICFYSPLLEARLGRALAHLLTSVDESPADLTVHVWDLAATNVEITPPWSGEHMSPQAVDTTRLAESGFLGAYLYGEESVTMFDGTNQTAYYFVQDASLLPSWVDAAPFRTLLHWFLTTHDIHLLHGAAVGREGKAVLLTARGGSGKSTTALSCAQAGMDYLGDDYVAVELHATGARVHSLFCSGKITVDTLKYFPEMIDTVGQPLPKAGEKIVVDMHSLYPRQISREAELAAILIPTIGVGDDTLFAPLHATRALLALAPTSLFQLPLADNAKLRTFRRIVESVPSQQVLLGRDVRAVGDAIQAFLV